MSMTREEAIELVCYGDWINILMLHLGDDDINRLAEAMCIIGNALRPVSREQVEKVWPGCPYCKEDGEGYVQKFGAYSIQNGELTTGHCKPQKIKFCPHCSRPLTDEAVEMVMERMDELQNEIG